MRANDYLRPGERIDDLQRGSSAPQEQTDILQETGAGHEKDSSPPQCGLRIIQDPSRFCFGMDAVLLSAYVQMKKARRGLDLGTGNGIIPILLSDRTDCRHLTGLEIQPASADLARRSVALNGLQDRISIVDGDIKEADRIFAAASFDFITCNPPYRTVGSGRVTGSSPAAEGSKGNPEDLDPRAIARHELLCTFDDVARAAAKLLRPGGHFYLVHRPLRLPELITTLCGRGLEPKRMRLVYPHIDQAPNMVLLDCVRGGGPELRVEPPLIVYEKDGNYTPELMQIYYD
jgi:tRNA1Val (adenine37-N6)-methyltransferase